MCLVPQAEPSLQQRGDPWALIHSKLHLTLRGHSSGQRQVSKNHSPATALPQQRFQLDRHGLTLALPAQSLPEGHGWLLFFGEESDIQKCTCANIPGLGSFDCLRDEPGPTFHLHSGAIPGLPPCWCRKTQPHKAHSGLEKKGTDSGSVSSYPSTKS